MGLLHRPPGAHVERHLPGSDDEGRVSVLRGINSPMLTLPILYLA